MIIELNGKLRQGKGILATGLAIARADKGVPVLCNYHIHHPLCKYIDFYDLTELLLKGRQEPQKTVVIDELPSWIDSRVSSSKGSRFATYFVDQSAKLGYDLIFTAQRNMRADIEYRELVDIRFVAEKDAAAKVFHYKLMDTNYPSEDVETGRVFHLPYMVASMWWDRYDTYEAVAPLGINELLVEMQKNDPERANRTINQQVDVILENSEYIVNQKITVALIKSVLLELHLPVTFAPFVHVRLLRKLGTPLLRKAIRQTPKKDVSIVEKYKEKWKVAST